MILPVIVGAGPAGIRAAQTLVPDFLGPGAKGGDDANNVLASTFVERQSVAPPPGSR